MAVRDYTGNLVIIEHPYIMDTHVIAKVVKQTHSRVSVRYWMHTRSKWNDVMQVRKISFKKVIHPNAAEVDDKTVAALSMLLFSAKEALDYKTKQALGDYNEKIRDISL